CARAALGQRLIYWYFAIW
nr:immunoglobulin heavy chain junction region [Macaca mulatta]